MCSEHARYVEMKDRTKKRKSQKTEDGRMKCMSGFKGSGTKMAE